MIMRLLLSVLLLIQLALGYDHSIDLKRCEMETFCLIRNSCFTHTSNKSKLDRYTSGSLSMNPYKALVPQGCDVMIQIKRLTDYKLHVMMQVTGELKPEAGLKLIQGETLFHCKPGQNFTGKSEFTIEMLGSQRFANNEIFCSFSVKLPSVPLKHSLDTAFHDFNEEVISTLKIEYVNEDYSKVVIGNDDYPQQAIWRQIETVSMIYRCDYDFLKSSNKEEDGLWLHELDTTLAELNCPYPFIIEMPDKVAATRIFCNHSMRSPKWLAEVAGTLTEIPPGSQVYCSEKICRKCESAPPPLACTNCKLPKFDAPKNGDDCPNLTCPNDKWTVTGSRILEGQATCNRSSADPTKFAWFVQGTELGNAACMEKIDCGARFHDTPRYPIVSASCPNGPDCKIVGLGTNRLTCKDGYSLKLTPGTAPEGAPIDKVECDTATGLFAGAAAVECIPNDKANRVCLDWAARA